jgi:hypothetical protein
MKDDEDGPDEIGSAVHQESSEDHPASPRAAWLISYTGIASTSYD